jgi:hypothetical protein
MLLHLAPFVLFPYIGILHIFFIKERMLFQIIFGKYDNTNFCPILPLGPSPDHAALRIN